MKKDSFKKLSNAELEWAIYIVSQDKKLTAVQMQSKIKEVFKTNVPLWEINLHLSNKSEEDFSVEHRKIEHGCNNNQFEFTKEV